MSVFACMVKDGCLVPMDRPRWAVQLARWTGKRVRVQIEPEKQRRSANQNGWYWAAVLPTVAAFLSESTGKTYSAEDAHFVCKSAFLGVDETPLGPVPRSTAVLSVEDFSSYCERIRAHAVSEWGLHIAGPEEYWTA